MDSVTVTQIIQDNILLFGVGVFAIITAVIGMGLGYLIFRMGWFEIKKSISTGGRVSNGVMDHDLIAFRKKHRSLVRRGLE